MAVLAAGIRGSGRRRRSALAAAGAHDLGHGLVDLVPHVAKEREVKAVLSNSFGFGGTNASLIMQTV